MNAENENIRYYLHVDELFPEPLIVYQKVEHGRWDRMLTEIKQQCKNVSRGIVMDFFAGCERCEKKKGVVVKLMVFFHMNGREQIDLINMQSQVYMHVSRPPHQFRYAKSTDIETRWSCCIHFIGHNHDIQGSICSDNDCEFCKSVISSLQEMWLECRVVYGKPRHSISRGSVKRVNQNIEKMLFIWKSDNKTTKWSECLRFIQVMKNWELHDRIKQSPYEVMFGIPVKINLEITFLPREIWDRLESEENV